MIIFSPESLQMQGGWKAQGVTETTRTSVEHKNVAERGGGKITSNLGL